MPLPIESLLAAAKEARQNAYAPYSGFRVGAALLTADGQVFAGCNVENATYGLTICAERVAIACAVAAGQRDFVALVVVADTPGPVSPCGMCRQTMVEFNPQLRVVLSNLQGDLRQFSAEELLPGAFTPADLALGAEGRAEVD